MRFRFFILMSLTVAVVAGTKPFYAQDDLFDEPAEPVAEADSGDIFADSDPRAEDELDDLFDDDEPVADANMDDAVDDLFGDADPTDDVPAEDLFGDDEPASNTDTDELDDLLHAPKQETEASPNSLLGGIDSTRPAADDDLTTANDTDDATRAELQSQSHFVRVHAIKLDKIRARQAAATLRTLYSGRQHEGLKVSCNPQKNLIILQGPDGLVKEVQMVLRALALRADEDTKDQYAEQSNPARQNELSFFNAAPPLTRGSMNELQKQVFQLRVRHQSVTDRESPGYDPSGKQARKHADELRTLIRQVFDARQRQQQQQIRQLQQRLAALQQRVQERERKRARITEQAVDDLLSRAEPNSQASRRRHRLLQTLGSIGHAATPEAALNDLQSQASDLLNQAVNIEPPSQSVLDVERAQQMVRKGYAPEEQLKQLQGQLTTQQLNVQLEPEQIAKLKQFEAAKLDQQRAEQIAADADFETNIKRLELNLAEAEAELEYTTVEFDALKRTHAKLGNSLSESQLRKVALQQRQAKIKVQRAELELQAAKRRGAKK